MTISIPPIISVDDHVIEPPDLWERWLPSKFREAGPKVIRAPWQPIPSGRNTFSRAESGPETDFWVFGEFRRRSRSRVRLCWHASIRANSGTHRVLGDAARRLPGQGTPAGHGRESHRKIALLPVMDPLLRPSISRRHSERRGRRPLLGLCEGLQRLDDRRVGR